MAEWQSIELADIETEKKKILNSIFEALNTSMKSRARRCGRSANTTQRWVISCGIVATDARNVPESPSTLSTNEQHKMSNPSRASHRGWGCGGRAATVG